jgi:hypothetical protein
MHSGAAADGPSALALLGRPTSRAHPTTSSCWTWRCRAWTGWTWPRPSGPTRLWRRRAWCCWPRPRQGSAARWPGRWRSKRRLPSRCGRRSSTLAWPPSWPGPARALPPRRTRLPPRWPQTQAPALGTRFRVNTLAIVADARDDTPPAVPPLGRRSASRTRRSFIGCVVTISSKGGSVIRGNAPAAQNVRSSSVSYQSPFSVHHRVALSHQVNAPAAANVRSRDHDKRQSVTARHPPQARRRAGSCRDMAYSRGSASGVEKDRAVVAQCTGGADERA